MSANAKHTLTENHQMSAENENKKNADLKHTLDNPKATDTKQTLDETYVSEINVKSFTNLKTKSFTDKIVSGLIDALESHEHGPSLSIRTNSISSEDLVRILTGVRGSALEEFGLHGITLESEAGTALATILTPVDHLDKSETTSRCHLTHLDLSECSMSKPVVKTIFESLYKNTQLKCLKLENCSFDDKILQIIASYMDKVPHLKELHLGSNLFSFNNGSLKSMESIKKRFPMAFDDEKILEEAIKEDKERKLSETELTESVSDGHVTKSTNKTKPVRESVNESITETLSDSVTESVNYSVVDPVKEAALAELVKELVKDAITEVVEEVLEEPKTEQMQIKPKPLTYLRDAKAQQKTQTSEPNNPGTGIWGMMKSFFW